MNVIHLIERLAATNSRNDKEAIIAEAFLSGHREFFVGSKLAYDVLITFGVAKVAEILEDDGLPGTFTFHDFLALADKLRTRNLTGHAARDAINAAAASCDFKTWNLFYRRVLMKDLGIGLTDGTINRTLAKLVKEKKATAAAVADCRVPVFDCMLAHSGDKPENAKHMRGSKMIDAKLDGVRFLARVDKESRTVTGHMRDGKPNNNFPHILDAMRPLLDILPASVYLDGEVVARNFNELMTKLSKKGADTSDTKLALFDIIPMKEFDEQGYCSTPQSSRHAVLVEMETSGLFANATNCCLYVIPKITMDLDTPEGQTSFNEFNKQALAAGFEGVMIKDPNAPYECKRSVNWLKKKPKISVTLAITGFEAGDQDGKNADRLGAFLCEGFDDGFDIKTKCGGGLTDDFRKEVWEKKEKFLGMMIEVEGDCLSLESGSNVYSVRFPVFKGFRGLVPGQKI